MLAESTCPPLMKIRVCDPGATSAKGHHRKLQDEHLLYSRSGTYKYPDRCTAFFTEMAGHSLTEVAHSEPGRAATRTDEPLLMDFKTGMIGIQQRLIDRLAYYHRLRQPYAAHLAHRGQSACVPREGLPVPPCTSEVA